MTRARKTKIEAIALGELLRSKRKSMQMTLSEASRAAGVDIGHLSRFERGDFSFVTPNLQRVATILQIQLEEQGPSRSLLERFSAAIKQSSRHEAAAAAMVLTLETLR
jgi:transcriptional regulator with XRE-family HTH domain